MISLIFFFWLKRKMARVTKYHRIFMASLTRYSRTDQPLKEWRYVGGDTSSRANWFDQLYPGRTKPSHQDQCICTHAINENCYIENILTKKLLVVGNCCVQRFLTEENQGRRCPHCNKLHNNRKDPWCNKCRGGIIPCGKYKNKSFRWTMENDLDYCRWILRDIRQGQLHDFKQWLTNQGIQAYSTNYVSQLLPSARTSFGSLTSRRTELRRRRSDDQSTQSAKRLRIDSTVEEIEDSDLDDQMEYRDLSTGEDNQLSNLVQPRGIFPNVINILTSPRDRALEVGKHKGQMFSWIYQHDKNYCRWAQNLAEPGKQLQSFIDWLQYQPLN